MTMVGTERDRSARFGVLSLRFLNRGLPVILCLVAWEFAVRAGLLSNEFLPRASEVLSALANLLFSSEFWSNFFISLFRAGVGLVTGSIAGVVIGFLMATSNMASRILTPFVTSTYSLPKTSLIPLFILWFGIGNVTGILTVMLSCLLPVVVSTCYGVRAIPSTMIWSAQAMGTSKTRMLWAVLLPASAVPILTGIRIALGFSFVLTISGEMIAAKSGIGKLIFFYGESGSYAYMFAAIVVMVVFAFAADRAVIQMINRLPGNHNAFKSAGGVG